MVLSNSALLHHCDTPGLMVQSITACVMGLDRHGLALRWRIEGAGAIIWPESTGCTRADGLWRSTCFELFLCPDGGRAYVEYNFSPSGQWAAYDFHDYRASMAERASLPPAPTVMGRGTDLAIFDVVVPAGGLPALPAAMGLTAVIVEHGGRLSYWAPAHPPGRPDFHNKACFTLRLEAPPPV